MSRSKQQRGFSLIETLVSLGLLGVMATQAAPSLSGMVQRQRLQGEAEAFRSDFQRARMLALSSGRSVRIAFGEHRGGSCYVVYQGESEACSCNASCAPARCMHTCCNGLHNRAHHPTRPCACAVLSSPFTRALSTP